MQGHAWPERPVRVIATSPPGGAVDLLARILADEFAKEHGQPFVVENRPGANGNIGVAAALQASADGHLLFVAPPGPFSINAQLMPSTRFDARADIAPIALLGVSPLVLAVHPSVPAADLRELVAWLKAQHGRVSYASQAVGSTGHLAMELFKTHVPYKGSAAQATADLLAGRVALGFVNTSTTLPYVRQGRLRAIGVAERARLVVAPDIPTLDEAGLAGFEATPWIGLGARAGTAPQIIDQLNASARRALERPEVLARLQRIGVEPRALSPAQFSAFIAAETEKWSAIIRRSGARAE